MDAAVSIVRDAYDRMAEGAEQHDHAWASTKKAECEVGYLCGLLEIGEGKKIIDFGCGNGRHSIFLSKRGVKVTGVDFSKSWLRLAKRGSEKLPEISRPTFIFGDCRSDSFGEDFDVGVCLYDVIGSFPNENHNIAILDNLVRHVKTGGYVVFSVMSYDYMADRAIHVLGNKDLQDALLPLESSMTMQSSGEIFNPNCILIDKNRRIFYRKEKFDVGEQLPVEHIIRDRRYTIAELKEICKKFGLEIECIGFVRAGEFDGVKCGRKTTKEILVVAKKSLI